MRWLRRHVPMWTVHLGVLLIAVEIAVWLISIIVLSAYEAQSIVSEGRVHTLPTSQIQPVTR